MGYALCNRYKEKETILIENTKKRGYIYERACAGNMYMIRENQAAGLEHC